MDTSVAIIQTAKQNRVRKLSAEATVEKNARRKISRQLKNADFVAKLLNGEVSTEEMEAFNMDKAKQKQANKKFAESGKKLKRSLQSLEKRAEYQLEVNKK